MDEQNELPFQAIATDQTENEQGACSAIRKGTLPVPPGEATENAVSWERPEGNWEGYRPEILSVWFDP